MNSHNVPLGPLNAWFAEVSFPLEDFSRLQGKLGEEPRRRGDIMAALNKNVRDPLMHHHHCYRNSLTIVLLPNI
jgi:hypothetical protein